MYEFSGPRKISQYFTDIYPIDFYQGRPARPDSQSLSDYTESLWMNG